MNRLYDIVAFGVSGYTGGFVLEELVKKAVSRSGLKIAVAGRSVSNMKNTLQKYRAITDVSWVEQVPIIEANTSHPETLNHMARQAKVVINCVGPFALLGEAVIKACIEERTHHIDICGETGFMERIQLEYNNLAQSNETYVIQSCALISAINELGVQYTQQQFHGQLNEIESFPIVQHKHHCPIHYGTWHSAVCSVTNASDLKSVRQQLYTVQLPEPEWIQRPRGMLFHEPTINRWCIPFYSSDRAIVYRTQYNHCIDGIQDRQIQFRAYMTLPSLYKSVLTIMGLMLFYAMCCFRFSRALLLKYPVFFSFGQVSHEGATRKAIEESSIEYIFIGKGWSSPAVDRPPDAKIITSITGPNAGYVTTAVCVVEGACTLLDDTCKMPNKGGVYTPGVAFRQTSFLERMQQRLQFSVISQ